MLLVLSGSDWFGVVDASDEHMTEKHNCTLPEFQFFTFTELRRA